MLARPKIVSAPGARNYFENDTYFISNEFEQGSFYGGLKNELGLSEFNLKDFDALLNGRHPQSGEQLIKLSKKDLEENGDRKRAACDLTFAADKSVSILYEISSDEVKAQIREAFTKSIDEALDFAEANYSNSKSRDNLQGAEAESKMLFTRFDHSESRNNDMHLHQHCLAINMIQDKEGNWRSVEFNQIMMNHQLIGQIQRNSFAQKLQALGYEVEISNAKVGSFSLKNVYKELRDKFSTRSDDIKKEMEASGQTSYKATHIAQKQTAKWKDKNKDREQIQEHNIERLKEAGADIELIKSQNPDLEIRKFTAKEAVEIAIEDTTDKKSVFTREDILKHSLKVSLTTDVSLSEIQKEFENYSELITINKSRNEYTTIEVLQKEEYIFSKKDLKTFKVTEDKEQIAEAIKEFETEKGFELKEGQNNLAHTILSSNSQFIVAQGVAGAGKSTSLEIVKNVAEANNIKVVALAPTGTATDNLAKEAGITESYTVAKFIQSGGAEIKDALVIIDEAGMLGLRDTHELVKIAEANNLKLVFSGDQNQKKSIEQGDIFSGLQRQGFETVRLNEGNRQKNDLMRTAVSSILDKDITAALDILKDTTREITNSDERLNAAQEEYLKDRHNSLLITTTNADRRALNSSIRSFLVKEGEITESQTFTTREVPSMSALEKRSAIYYQAGEKVYLSKNIGSISAGREAKILSVDIDKNTLSIEHTFKDKVFTETVDLSKQGNSLNLFKETKTDIGIGDQIIMKKNDTKLGLKNGQIGKITAIKEDEITVKFDKSEKTFSVKNYKYIAHAYAITDFASQGKTTDKVIAVANSQAASFNDFYTQITRAKNEAHIITDDLEELKKRAARDSQKLNASEMLKAAQIKPEGMIPMKREIKTLESSEFNELSSKTKQELKLTDPAKVLDALNIDYKIKNGRYEFKVRDENTASANMYIDNKGEWKYKDFGGNNGTIENLVMDLKDATYKEALEFAVANSGIRNYVQERLDYLNGKNHTYKTPSVNNLETIKQENISKVEAQINSKVVETKEIDNYKPALDYLASRGIYKIPKEFKMITGQYTNKNEEVKKAFGIGIESIGGGADIHFLKQIGSLKTMNFGVKNISHFKSQEPVKKVAIFESKMDYAAAYQNRDFTGTDVIIANSTANHLKVSEAIKAAKYESFEFYNQNDKPGIEFVKNVVAGAEIKKFEYIKYKKSEAGQDINDLHKNGVNTEERKIQNRQPEQKVEKEKESFVEKVLDKLEHTSDLIEIAVDR
ncbi:MobF family relaxase, partial [Sulfurimonas sp.]|uniref:MobF family relaxase n=1 Tax=Sulfurimonas sp. TaxID=2022749 RepID=UPI002A35A7B7